MVMMKRICVYAGSNPGNDPAYIEAAVHLGKELARQGIALVYGGSRVGLMGKLADTVLGDGGEVIGVMPAGLFRGEMRHPSLTRFIETADMHERKATMASLSDGFIALPGGYGTFEELFEALSWLQIGIHRKPVGLLNVEGFYAPLQDFVIQASRAGFIHEKHVRLCLMDESPASLLKQMGAFETPEGVNKWTDLEK